MLSANRPRHQVRRIAWATTMGSIQVSHVGWRRPGGAELLRDVSFTVGNGDRVALVGANGVGKSTLMRLIAGEADRHQRHDLDRRPARRDAPAGRRQRPDRARPDGVARPRSVCRTRPPGWHVPRQRRPSEPMRYATALAEWGDAGGYDAEVFWDACCTKADGRAVRRTGATACCAPSAVASRSAWRSRRCCAATTTCCCSTSPTTSSTCPASDGWRPNCAPAARRCCSSATIASCWPRRRPRSSPSKRAEHGPTAADSPATTRPARHASRTASTHWRSTRTNARGSRSSSSRCVAEPRSATRSRRA